MWWFPEPFLGWEQQLPSSKIMQNYDLNTSSHRNQSDFKTPAARTALWNLLPQGSPVHHLSLAHITQNKLLNNRWLAANSERLQQWPFHPHGDDLPWFTSISWWRCHQPLTTATLPRAQPSLNDQNLNLIWNTEGRVWPVFQGKFPSLPLKPCA